MSAAQDRSQQVRYVAARTHAHEVTNVGVES